MKRYSLLVLLLITVVGSAVAQKNQAITQVVPETAGFSSERLKRIDNAMNEWVQKEWMQCGEALIIRNGKIVYYKTAGYNDPKQKLH